MILDTSAIVAIFTKEPGFEVLVQKLATHLLKGDADVRHVQAILGHKKLQTTSLYTRVVVEDLREVLERAHPRERDWRGEQAE